jgi:RNA 2',3'-cyclic 3'-phosphodiesterase
MGRDRAARTEARPLRLFAAADIPTGHAEATGEALERWRGLLPGGRWDPPEKWHVTLKFLGRTWPRLVGTVQRACASAAAAVTPFEVRLGEVGVFPGPSRARVLWVGLDDPEGGLARLAAGLEQRLAAEFPPEKRAFTPHLTVARFRPPVSVREHREELEASRVDAPPFTVDRILLYRSHLLGPRGSRYEVMEEFPLAR